MNMTEFDKLADDEKAVQIFEAKKIAERSEDSFQYQLFSIDDFFVEVRTHDAHFPKRTINYYEPKDLPANYPNSF
jgi:hypothetical protein